MGEGFNINNIDITNEDVVITFTPSSNIKNYSYTVLKNDEYNEAINVDNNEPIDIKLNESGVYRIEVTTYDYYGEVNLINSGEYVIDKEAPVLNIKNKTFKIKNNQTIDLMNNITASDIVDGDLTSSITTNISDLDFTKEGVKTVIYSVKDKAGNETIEKAYVTVVHDNSNLIRIGQLSIALIAIILITLLFRYVRSLMIERRFSKYTINSTKNNSISLFDNIYSIYINFVNKLGNILSNSSVLSKMSKKYTKYNIAFNLNDDTNMKFMANKVILGFIYALIIMIIKLIQSEYAQIYEVIIAFIIGFYVLDVVYIYKYINYRKKIENDLLQAITIMNNSFKSGNSITQAVEMVSLELKGPIAKEFKQISTELSLGLDLDVSFKRFSDRVNITEAIYLTSSLSTLNRTGGNIIKVFDTIEKTLYNRKKLRIELQALTSSSKLIMYILIIVPPAFILLINLINPDYFKPLYTNPLGITLIGIILLLYITYIIVVRRVMKVRM